MQTANQRDVSQEIQQQCAGIQAQCRWQEHRNNFAKLNPPTFLGGANHSEAVAWLIKMNFSMYLDALMKRVNHATYRLSGTAIIWWQLEKSKCKQGTEPCTWDSFENAFCAQYIPNSVQMAEDLINLKQKKLTVFSMKLNLVNWRGLCHHGWTVMRSLLKVFKGD